MPPATRRRVIHYNAASRMRLGPELVFTGNARVKFYVAHKRCIYVHTPPGRSPRFSGTTGKTSTWLFRRTNVKPALFRSFFPLRLLLAGGRARNLKQRRDWALLIEPHPGERLLVLVAVCLTNIVHAISFCEKNFAHAESKIPARVRLTLSRLAPVISGIH